jgi:hypothetical protein
VPRSLISSISETRLVYGTAFLGGILTSGDREIELDTVTARLNINWGGL